MVSQRNALRRELRRRRRALTPTQQRQAAEAACKRLIRLPEYLTAKRIALYLPNDGELNPCSLRELAWCQRRELYLPVLHPLFPGRLIFRRYLPHQAMVSNRFGIPEPDQNGAQHCQPWTLDLVIAPLVGFDRRGNRMGMGGGFYDRTFAFVRQGLRPKIPKLVGFAHDCQQVDALPYAPWDVPMVKIVTDRQVITVE